MPSDGEDSLPADRDEPVGAPVVRGDPEITGAHAQQAARFDPDDPESLREAARVVQEFARNTGESGQQDSLAMLRGAAAAGALVRGEGSYEAAAARADVSVAFLRKWARVHDLPLSIRRHIARGAIAPTAAMHIARVTGDARLVLAWAVLDAELSVSAVREVASAVNDGADVEAVLRERGVHVGEVMVELDRPVYREVRRRASLEDESLSATINEALRQWLADH